MSRRILRVWFAGVGRGASEAAQCCGNCHWFRNKRCKIFEHVPAAAAPFWCWRTVVAQVGEDEGRDCATWEARR